MFKATISVKFFVVCLFFVFSVKGHKLHGHEFCYFLFSEV